MKKILLIIAMLIGVAYGQSQNSNYILPYRTQTNYLRIQNLPQGSASDSILVVSGNLFRWIGKRSINDYGFITGSYTGFDNRYRSSTAITNWSDIQDKPLVVSIELDPTVSTYVKGITASYFANGNTAFTWGNHTGLYRSINWSPDLSAYRTKSQNDLLYKSIGYVPTALEITTALGYTPVNDAVSITINSTAIGLSKATLNATYPNVKIGYQVFCPFITLGGAIYIKVTENGSSDVWQAISSPPAL